MLTNLCKQSRLTELTSSIPTLIFKLNSNLNLKSAYFGFRPNRAIGYKSWDNEKNFTYKNLTFKKNSTDFF